MTPPTCDVAATELLKPIGRFCDLHGGAPFTRWYSKPINSCGPSALPPCCTPHRQATKATPSDCDCDGNTLWTATRYGARRLANRRRDVNEWMNDNLGVAEWELGRLVRMVIGMQQKRNFPQLPPSKRKKNKQRNRRARLVNHRLGR